MKSLYFTLLCVGYHEARFLIACSGTAQFLMAQKKYKAAEAPLRAAVLLDPKNATYAQDLAKCRARNKANVKS